MFRTPLKVVHASKKDWELTEPLVWEGKWEYFIIRSGFVTDFASIPRPVRWLLDNAGRNSEAAVLHDAAWRESQLERPRVDPWHADGVFRRALRQTGSTALARGVMWLAVRTAAMAHGRFGSKGPGIGIKVLQLVAIFLLALLTVIPTTLVAIVGLVGYWLASWVVAVGWYLLFERRVFTEGPNWPWPLNKAAEADHRPYSAEDLVIIPKPGERVGSGGIAQPFVGDQRSIILEGLLANNGAVSEDDVDRLVAEPALVGAAR